MMKTKNGTNLVLDKKRLLSLTKILSRMNLTRTQELLMEEAKINSEELEDISEDTIQSLLSALTSAEEVETPKVASSYNGNNNVVAVLEPELYSLAFENLKSFVDESLDIYKYELSTVLYPVLVQIYIKLVRGGCENAALKFVRKYESCLESFYKEDIQQLLLLRRIKDLEDSDLVQSMETDKFVLKMSRDAHSLLKRHLQDRKQEEIAEIVAKYLQFDTYEGTARSKRQCDASAGSQIGEARRQDNKVRVYYGLFKEVDFQSLVPQAPAAAEEDDDDLEPDKPKKKKSKRDPLFSKKSKSDPNAPAIDRIPLPELKDTEKLEKLKALRESAKRVNLNKDTLPSVCLYTLVNSQNMVCCAEISEDATLMAVGMASSNIFVWSLTSDKLLKMKSAEQLKDVDKDSEDIHVRMMDESSGESMRNLIGHSGSVYRCSFSPDKLLLISCSEDTTIRLWSMQVWECLVVYRGHLFPVWDVRFSPHGYYFASGSLDKTARIWATDNPQPLRLMNGHLTDVACVQFHPNSNYLATGSSDRTVRLFDVLNGQMVRLMTGHKKSIHSLLFSNCGRYLISGSTDCTVNVWDIANGQLVASLLKHMGTIQSMAFSREGTVLATGGSDYQLALWDFSKLTEEYISRGGSNVSHNIEQINSEDILLRVFASKQTPFLALHFSRRNYLLASGPFKQ